MTLKMSIFYASKILFRFVCFCSAIIMTITMVLRYYENGDTSTISYKRFVVNQEAYPTFTICLTGHPKLVITDKIKELHLTQNDYLSMLKGSIALTNKSIDQFRTVLNSQFEDMAIPLASIITKIKFERNDKSESIWYEKQRETDDGSMLDIDNFIFISYIDPDLFCFSRKVELEKLSARKKDEVVLHFSSLNDALYSGDAKLKIFFHIPGQLARNFEQPSQVFKLTDLTEESLGIQMSLSLAYVSVLKKRPDSIKRCNQSLDKDDDEFRRRIVQEVGCVPAYWKNNLNIKQDLCNSSQKLQSFYNLIQSPMKVFQRYNPPCNEALIIAKVETKKLTRDDRFSLSISIMYTTETYQEIRNERAFGIEALGSGVGGFIGIFLGYSLLQVPELFEIDWKTYTKFFWEIFSPIKLFGYLSAFVGIKRKRACR